MDSLRAFAVIETGPNSVKLDGELDLAGVPEVRACLARIDGDIELDCSGLSFIDCSGLGMLVGVHQACDARGVKLVLVAPPACMTRLLVLTKLDELFHMQLEGSLS